MSEHLVQAFNRINQLIDSHPKNNRHKNHMSAVASKFLHDAKKLATKYEKIPLEVFGGSQKARTQEFESTLNRLLDEVVREIAYIKSESYAEDPMSAEELVDGWPYYRK